MDVKAAKQLEKLVSEKIDLSLDRKKGKFTLMVHDQVIHQNICEFLLTNSFLVTQNIEELLSDTSDSADHVRIPLTSTGKSITLSLSDFITFKELYIRQMYLLRLEEMLVHRGIHFQA